MCMLAASRCWSGLFLVCFSSYVFGLEYRPPTRPPPIYFLAFFRSSRLLETMDSMTFANYLQAKKSTWIADARWQLGGGGAKGTVLGTVFPSFFQFLCYHNDISNDIIMLSYCYHIQPFMVEAVHVLFFVFGFGIGEGNVWDFRLTCQPSTFLPIFLPSMNFAWACVYGVASLSQPKQSGANMADEKIQKRLEGPQGPYG